MKAFFFFLTLCSLSFGGLGVPFTMATIDTSSTNLTTGYDGPAAQVQSNLAGVGHVLVWNGTASDIGISVPSGSGCTVSSPDHLVAPGVAGGFGVAVDDISVNNVVCLRSLTGGLINSGIVYVSVW